mgnify:CR=1 FL=1
MSSYRSELSAGALGLSEQPLVLASGQELVPLLYLLRQEPPSPDLVRAFPLPFQALPLALPGGLPLGLP